MSANTHFKNVLKFSNNCFISHWQILQNLWQLTMYPVIPVYTMKCNKILQKSDLWPKSSVDLVSVSLYDAGEQQMTIVVRAFPPRLSCSIRVNLLSRYGMKPCNITHHTVTNKQRMGSANKITVPSISSYYKKLTVSAMHLAVAQLYGQSSSCISGSVERHITMS